MISYLKYSCSSRLEPRKSGLFQWQFRSVRPAGEKSRPATAGLAPPWLRHCSTQFWRCQRVGSCKVRLHTCVATNDVIRTIGVHSDEPSPAEIEVKRRQQCLKRRAESTQETPLQVIENAFEGSTQAAKLLAPSCETLSKMVNRARKTMARPPPIPPDAASIVIPVEYTMYEFEPERFETFLIGDSGKEAYGVFAKIGGEDLSSDRGK